MSQLKNAAAEKWMLLPMRLVIGYGFMVHGWAKFTRGPEGFAALLSQIGTPAPKIMAWVVTGTELQITGRRPAGRGKAN